MKSKKLAIILSLVLVATFGFSGNALAAKSDNWIVSYAKDVPGCDPEDELFVAYDSDGYRANCTYLEGSDNRKVTITSTSAGGMTPKEITKTGITYSWKMKRSSTTNVKFIVKGTGTLSCASRGTIYVNN